jgi:RNA polymerase sigma factor (sigma-70 family)
MSPLSLRRYRAERLLRDEFERLRGRVLAGVRRQLRASGVSLDQADLEACYAQAWQGLYAAVLDGKQIANPAGWLMLVTFRRALEEHRARTRAGRRSGSRQPVHAGGHGGADHEMETGIASERDLAAELDDRVRLRQLFEGLRGRLDGREREAATLCYLQGLSRSEAAARMGVSEARMRKLMEGRGPAQPGVAGKVGALVTSIRDGDWCDEQGSLMRALAYGILDPAGERYRLALMHHSQCPACRAYVVSLRGLAAVLPPVFLPWALGAGVLAGAAEGSHAAAAVGATGAGTGGAGAGAQAARGLGGATSASGAAGAAGAGGAAGGSWLLTGGLGAKLAVGCMVALGVGAGCVALESEHRAVAPRHRHAAASRPYARAAALTLGGYPVGAPPALAPASTSARSQIAAPAWLTTAARASREFGPEQALASGGAGSAARVSHRAGETARSASSGSGPDNAAGSIGGGLTDGESTGGGSSSSEAPAPSGAQSSTPSAAGESAAAEREFAPG